jgi:hypothetical protein
VGAAAAALVIAWNMSIFDLAARIPGVRGVADRILTRKLILQLACYGHAEFRTNADAYRSVAAAKSASPSKVAS